MLSNQSFSTDGITYYDIENINLQESGVSLFDARSGIGGVDYMPADGDTVYIIVGGGSNKIYQKFQPGMNNKAYYLVSDTEYGDNDKDTILTQATEVPVVYSATDGGRYEGSFVFSNPNDLPYLYVIWDYSDNLDAGVVSYYGNQSDRIIDCDFGTDYGSAGINYVIPDEPARIQLKWNDLIIADTGFIGLNSNTNYVALINAGIDPSVINLTAPYDGLVNNGTGQIRFNKYLQTSEAKVFVTTVMNDTAFFLERVDPTLTSFYIDSDAGTLANVCSQVPDELLYHDGAGLLPTTGDRIYAIDNGVYVLWDGGSDYHQTSTTSLLVPPVSGGTYVAVNSIGAVFSHGGCDCTEFAPPFIYQEDITLQVGKKVSINLLATGNPTSWSIVNNTCNDYTLTGGDNGTIYSYTSCDGLSKRVTVSASSIETVSATGTPTVIGGGGSATLVGPSQQNILPAGISISDTGVLSGTPTDSCSFTFDIRV
jgi:hypothetical protein